MRDHEGGGGAMELCKKERESRKGGRGGVRVCNILENGLRKFFS